MSRGNKGQKAKSDTDKSRFDRCEWYGENGDIHIYIFLPRFIPREATFSHLCLDRKVYKDPKKSSKGQI